MQSEQSTPVFPLLAVQQAVWMADRAAADASALLAAEATALPPGTQPDLFIAACRMAAQTVPAMRMRVAGPAAQRVLPPGTPFTMPMIDVDGEAQAAAWMAGARRMPIDPRTEPPFRWTLLCLASGRLVWSQIAHHVAADAAGRHRLRALVTEIYEALAHGRAPPAVGAEPSLASLAAAEAAYAGSERYRADAAWCAAQCAEPPPAVSLGRASAGTLHSHRASGLASPAEQAGLQRAAAELGVSLAQLLCAAWAALLSRLAGQTDLLLGFQTAARLREARALPAMTTNAMPLRLQFAPGARFAELAATVARQCRGVLRHQHYPHTHLRRALGLSPAGPGLLDIGFNFLPRGAHLMLAGQPVTTTNLSHGPVPDLSLAVEDEADGLRFDLDANHGRYSAAEAERLLSRLLLVLADLARPGQALTVTVAALPIMDAAERNRVVSVFSDGGPTPAAATLASRLADRIAQSPGVIALQSGAIRLSYAELGARAQRFTEDLARHGLGAGDAVALDMPRTAALIVAIVACALAGIAICPLDPAHPPPRRAQMLATSGARALLTAGAITMLPGIPPRPGPAAPLSGSTIAYIAFTSGSSGAPKGVAIAQAAIALHVAALQAQIPLAPGDAVIGATTFSFDVGLGDVFLALTAGATLVLLDAQAMRDPGAIAAALCAHDRPFMQATPTVWRTLPLERLPASLRAVIGGEPFPAELLPRLLRLRAVFNVYGPTEATVWATLQRVDATMTGQPVPVGRPLAGYHVWVLDPAGEALPAGGIGELCVGGAAVAGGYLGQSSAAFTGGAERVYRSGDMARWREDGALELLGRRDGQLKLAGHRVEPGDIERALHDLPWVAEAAVKAWGEPGPRRLVAYAVPRPGAAVPDAAGLRRQLASGLPPWMLPADLVMLPAMPRTVNAKVDRRALLAPMAARPHCLPAAAPATATDGLEAELRRRFGRLTGHADVTRDDDFFAIGGDSLAAMLLIAELSALGHAVPLAALLAGPTPAALAASIRPAPMAAGAVATVPVVFLIPGVGGDDLDLAAFRGACAGTVQFVPLEYPDWPDTLRAGYGAGDLAQWLAGRIRRLAPDGPVRLAGYSLGASVAIAAAAALQAAGREVASLLLFDIRPPAAAPPHGPAMRIRAFAAECRRDLRNGQPERPLLTALATALAGARRPYALAALARLRRVKLPGRPRYWLRYTVSRELRKRILEPWRDRWLRAPWFLAGVPTVLFQVAPWPAWLDEHASRLGGRPNLLLVTVAGDHTSMLHARGPGSLHEAVTAALRPMMAARPDVTLP